MIPKAMTDSCGKKLFFYILMKLILLLGPSGAGKGSVSQWLVEHKHYCHLSTGRIFRSLGNQDSTLAKEILKTINAGALVSDHLTNNLLLTEVQKLVTKNPNINLILDGYPRNICQAQFFDKHFKFDHVIVLECDVKTILFRLTHRYLCKLYDHSFHAINKPPKIKGICDIDQSPLYQRKDDDPNVILKRIEIYQTQTQALIDYYAKQNLVNKIDASQDFNQTVIKVDQILKSKK